MWKTLLTAAGACAILSGCTGGVPKGSRALASANQPDDVSHAQCSSQPATAPIARRVFTNSVGIECVWVPGGTFQMGTDQDDRWFRREEGHRHTVTLASPFWVSVNEVTQEQYERVMGRTPRKRVSAANVPVANVSWDDAVKYCEQLSSKEGRRYRLPTEAEWEYCCRAGTSTPWSFGDAPELIAEYAVCAEDRATRGPASVASRKPNPWGLYDMHGNVSEWVLDATPRGESGKGGGMSEHEFDLPEYPAGDQTDPKGVAQGILRISRGGSYKFGSTRATCAKFCRSAAREGQYRFMHSEDTGFRIVCEVEGNTASKLESEGSR